MLGLRNSCKQHERNSRFCPAKLIPTKATQIGFPPLRLFSSYAIAHLLNATG
jgi:hypothetical protein